MTSQIKAKLLQHFAAKKKADGGFTLIELLVVIIIIGILSAIALPSFLNQANKAKQSEAKTYIGSMNRAQQAYYMEKGAFVTATTNLGQLGLGISPTTSNYQYDITTATDAGAVAATNQAKALPAGTAATKSYIGGVEIGTVNGSESTTLAVLCEADSSQATAANAADVDGSQTFVTDKLDATPPVPDDACGANYTAIK